MIGFAALLLLKNTAADAQQDGNQPAVVSAATDSASILIGQQFHLMLEGSADSTKYRLFLPEVPDSFNTLEVVDRGQIDTLTQDGKQVLRQLITVTGFDSGQWTIPAFDFRVVPVNGGQQQTLHSDSLIMVVNTIQVDTTKPFKPIKNIREVPFNILDYWLYILIGLIVIAIIIIVIWRLRKKKDVKPQPVAPAVPPYEMALQRLHELEKEKLWQHGAVKEYYTRLTDTLRLYIQQQYHIQAMELTSDELLQKIKDITQLSQQKDKLREILATADLAKFAKSQPVAEEHEACMRNAYEIVEWTKPKPKPKPEPVDKDKSSEA